MRLIHPDFPRIISDTDICFGRPCIKNSRITVANILSYLSSGMAPSDIIKEFNWLTLEDINEALTFAAKALDDRFLPLQKAS
ncbi:MAG: DUF433 domain-containing protein [Bacteroidota bacterium]|nr:DUF433 domain-containing protein [Bacteroidota bacterium]